MNDSQNNNETEFRTSGYMIFIDKITNEKKNEVQSLLNDVKGFNKAFEEFKLEEQAENTDMHIVGIVDVNDPDIDEHWHFNGYTVTNFGILFDYSKPFKDSQMAKNNEIILFLIQRLENIGVELDNFSFTDVGMKENGILVTSEIKPDDDGRESFDLPITGYEWF